MVNNFLNMLTAVLQSDRLKSRKFWIMLAGNVLAMFLSQTGGISPEDAQEIIKLLTGLWMVAQGFEDGAKRIGGPKLDAQITPVTPQQVRAKPAPKNKS